jgi:hypothetical protein
MHLSKAKVMFKNLRDKVAMSGFVVLGVGVALLVFTFISAYGFLTQSLSIIASADLVRTFGQALAPLIEASIHIMYLGIMGWVSSLLTIRGVTLIAHAPPAIEQPLTNAQKPVAPPQQKPQPQKEKAKVEQPPQPPQPQKETKPPEKEEAKPPEPEIVVIPPEQVQVQQQSEQPKQNEQQQPSS